MFFGKCFKRISAAASTQPTEAEKKVQETVSPSRPLWIKDFFSSYSDQIYASRRRYEITDGTKTEFINYFRNYLFPLHNGGIEKAYDPEMQIKYDEYMKLFRGLTNADLELSFIQSSTCDIGDRSMYVEETVYHFKNIPFPEFVAYLNLIQNDRWQSIEVTSGELSGGFIVCQGYPFVPNQSPKLFVEYIMATYGSEQTDADRQLYKLMRPC